MNAGHIPSSVRTASLNVGGVPMPARTAAVDARAAKRSLGIATRNAAGGTVAADDARVGTDTRADSPCDAASEVLNRTRDADGEPLSPCSVARAAGNASRGRSQAAKGARNEEPIGDGVKRNADGVARNALGVAVDAGQATRSFCNTTESTCSARMGAYAQAASARNTAEGVDVAPVEAPGESLAVRKAMRGEDVAAPSGD